MLQKMQHHQMVQSPARLGLTSSNSSPPPPPKHPPMTNTAPLLSPALVPLLPPLSRAHTILHHIASISSALFQASQKHPFWLSSFRGTLPTFLSTPAAASPSSTQDLLSAAATLQTHLLDAVAQLEHILDAHRTLDALQRQIRLRQDSALSFAEKLKNAQRLLDMILDDYSHYRPSAPLHNSDITLSDILSYAHRVSYTTFAPPDFGAHLAPLRGALPPAPQEEQMRASRLFSVSGRDLGLPEAEERREETLMEPPVVVKEMAVPAAPSGWRPGMPVELPGDMSSVVVVPPAGWRPGDPVSLPPQGEEMLRRETEPIHVRHVQLDITLDQDEDSSDYSTDVGSSEDDDPI